MRCRHGCPNRISTRAENSSRSAVVPCAPTMGKICLASEVPSASDVIEPSSHRMGFRGKAEGAFAGAWGAAAGESMTVKAESGKGGARTPGAMKLRHRRWEAARPRPARYPATGAPGSVARKIRTVQREGRRHAPATCARPSMIRRTMRIPSGAARWPDHRRESVADLTTRSLLSRHSSRMGAMLPTVACRMYRERARPSCHGAAGQADRNHRTMRAMRA